MYSLWDSATITNHLTGAEIPRAYRHFRCNVSTSYPLQRVGAESLASHTPRNAGAADLSRQSSKYPATIYGNAIRSRTRLSYPGSKPLNSPQPKHLDYGAYTSRWNVPGIGAGRGFGRSLVAAGGFPNSAASKKMCCVSGS